MSRRAQTNPGTVEGRLDELEAELDTIGARVVRIEAVVEDTDQRISRSSSLVKWALGLIVPLMVGLGGYQVSQVNAARDDVAELTIEVRTAATAHAQQWPRVEWLEVEVRALIRKVLRLETLEGMD